MGRNGNEHIIVDWGLPLKLQFLFQGIDQHELVLWKETDVLGRQHLLHSLAELRSRHRHWLWFGRVEVNSNLITQSPSAEQICNQHRRFMRCSRAFVRERADNHGNPSVPELTQCLLESFNLLHTVEGVGTLCKSRDALRSQSGTQGDNEIIEDLLARWWCSPHALTTSIAVASPWTNSNPFAE